MDEPTSDSLDEALAHTTGGEPEARVDFVCGGYKARVVAPASEGTLTVCLEAEQRTPSALKYFSIELRAPTRADLEHRRIFGNRRATGDARFDAEVFVISWGAPRVLRRILADSGARQAALWLIERGFGVKMSSVLSPGVEATSRGPVGRPDGGFVREVAARLALLVQVFLEKLQEGEAAGKRLERLPSWVPDAPRVLAQYNDTWRGAVFSAAVMAWALALAVPMVFWTPVEFRVQLYVVLLSFVLALPFVARSEFEEHDLFDQGEQAGGLRGALRKGPGKFFWASFVSMLMTAPAAELAIVGTNAVGAGPPVEHPTEVLEVLDSNILRVRGWQPGRPTETIHGKWTTYAPGDPVVVSSRRGLWGWEFRSLRPAPASPPAPRP